MAGPYSQLTTQSGSRPRKRLPDAARNRDRSATRPRMLPGLEDLATVTLCVGEPALGLVPTGLARGEVHHMGDHVAAVGERTEERVPVGNRDRRQDRDAGRHRRNFALWQGSQTFSRARTRHNVLFGRRTPRQFLMNRIARHLLVTCALALLALPAPAFASADQVVRDCVYDGKLDHHYSNAELRHARDHLPVGRRRVLRLPRRDRRGNQGRVGPERRCAQPRDRRDQPGGRGGGTGNRPVRPRVHRGEQRQGADRSTSAARASSPTAAASSTWAGRPTRFRFPC